MTKQADYYLLDVFTEKKYGGNQLAIFPDAHDIDESLFQTIARELNLSETVFLFPQPNGKPYSMRIYTPGKELPTAGHPTVGTAFFLTSLLTNPAKEVILHLQQKVGLIKVTVEMTDGKPGMVTMEQPLPVFGPTHGDKKDLIAQILGIGTADLDDLPVQEVSCGNNSLLVPVKNTEVLSRISVNTDLWKRSKPQFGNGFLYVFTTHGVTEGDVQGRMFAPEIGIPEDPATGSANGPLTAYLTQHRVISMPAKSLQGYEMGRPSQLYLNSSTDANGQITSLTVGGYSVFTGKGVHFLESV